MNNPYIVKSNINSFSFHPGTISQKIVFKEEKRVFFNLIISRKAGWYYRDKWLGSTIDCEQVINKLNDLTLYYEDGVIHTYNTITILVGNRKYVMYHSDPKVFENFLKMMEDSSVVHFNNIQL